MIDVGTWIPIPAKLRTLCPEGTMEMMDLENVGNQARHYTVVKVHDIKQTKQGTKYQIEWHERDLKKDEPKIEWVPFGWEASRYSQTDQT